MGSCSVKAKGLGLIRTPQELRKAGAISKTASPDRQLCRRAAAAAQPFPVSRKGGLGAIIFWVKSRRFSGPAALFLPHCLGIQALSRSGRGLAASEPGKTLDDSMFSDIPR